MPSRVPKHLYLPSPDRSYWQVPPNDTLPLLYLAWGRRNFHREGIPPSTHEGWICAVITEGAPTILLDGQAQSMAPGYVVVARENCALGWRQEHGRDARILVWMWRKPHSPEFSARPSDFSVTGKLPAVAVAELDRLHRACRDDVLHADRFTPRSLQAVQCQLEVILLRNLGVTPDGNDRARLVATGLAWMKQHLNSTEPVARLCDFLGLSQPTLYRIFHEQTGASALAAFRRLRMEEGRRLLRIGRCTVKKVAATLGYTHFNDFSRAYRAHFGCTPTENNTTPGKRKKSTSAKHRR